MIVDQEFSSEVETLRSRVLELEGQRNDDENISHLCDKFDHTKKLVFVANEKLWKSKENITSLKKEKKELSSKLSSFKKERGPWRGQARLIEYVAKLEKIWSDVCPQQTKATEKISLLEAYKKSLENKKAKLIKMQPLGKYGKKILVNKKDSLCIYNHYSWIEITNLE